MEWRVVNALSRDVEREHLNKILKDIRSEVDKDASTANASSSGQDVRAIVGTMVENNSEQGIGVTYNPDKKVLDFAISNFTLKLSGDVTGSVNIVGLRSATIITKLDPKLAGIPEAPFDDRQYTRGQKKWNVLSRSIEALSQLRGTGFIQQTGEDEFDANPEYSVREFEAEMGQLEVTNPSGATGNVKYGLALLPNSGQGALLAIQRDNFGRVLGSKSATITGTSNQIDVVNGNAIAGLPTISLANLVNNNTGLFKLIDRDSKGRLAGTKDGTTSDVPEGSNLYHTAARVDAHIAAAKADPNGIASLVSGKLDAGQLPALAITQTFVVNTEAAMLALDCQQGDVAVRADLSKSLILTTEPASTLANWQELLTPTGGVSSFNGRTGPVVPATGDYTAAQVGADPDGTAAAIVTQAITDGDTAHAPSGNAVFAALAGKANTIKGALVYPTSIVNAPSGVTTAIPMDAADYDDAGFFNIANPTRLTVPADGRYQVAYSISFDTNTAGQRLGFINKNGGAWTGRPALRIPTSGGRDYVTATSAVVSAVAGDYFELFANQNSGSDLAVAGQLLPEGLGTWLSIQKVG